MDDDEEENTAAVGCFMYLLGFGTTISIVMSYYSHQSVLWAIIHGVCGWFYVAYRVIREFL